MRPPRPFVPDRAEHGQAQCGVFPVAHEARLMDTTGSQDVALVRFKPRNTDRDLRTLGTPCEHRSTSPTSSIVKILAGALRDSQVNSSVWGMTERL